MKIEDQLEKDGFALMYSVGDSMEPMLHQRTEQLLIEKINKAPKTGDVVLYKRDSGQYVLHRIIKKKKDYYIIRGDNRYNNEKVPAYQLIGILKGFYREEKFIDCESNEEYLSYKKSLKFKLSYFSLSQQQLFEDLFLLHCFA
jgi:signal peptidase I